MEDDKKNKLKNRTAFNSTISKSNKNKLDELSERTMINKSRLIDQALELLFAKYDKPAAE